MYILNGDWGKSTPKLLTVFINWSNTNTSWESKSTKNMLKRKYEKTSQKVNKHTKSNTIKERKKKQ